MKRASFLICLFCSDACPGDRPGSRERATSTETQSIGPRGTFKGNFGTRQCGGHGSAHTVPFSTRSFRTRQRAVSLLDFRRR
jgi:hypothetical protein